MNSSQSLDTTSKGKRLALDTDLALKVIRTDAMTFDYPCLMYALHGAQTKQLAYATNKLCSIEIMVHALKALIRKLDSKQHLTFHCSFPAISVQAEAKSTNPLATEDWIINRWMQLLPKCQPDRYTFHARYHQNQSKLNPFEPPGSIEIRLSKSMGAMQAFVKHGNHLMKNQVTRLKNG